MEQTKPFDSRQETFAHIEKVAYYLDAICGLLHDRAFVHDASKLEEPEKSMFDAVTGCLKGCTYGSDEYKSFLKELRPALDHHYEHNSHHPEHFANNPEDLTNGVAVARMSLLDVVEMLCDWKAAGERHADGSMQKSLEHNRGRFGISPQLQSILENTARELGWLPRDEKD